ncbi:MAG: tRNA (adenosine(37)-N6)-dimethylallyltransferase MiaA [Candidatus Abyssobacteria bacterium SURF_5]|uniref:tRNA dimethylallyltransferase n=1 Tax=Abyssobacteria bacterium (strain SURF_5) TaxID=2093360 RepID=A0A3A4N0L2_ABYX5|nr:MAG: tRNA (adenosine(37)-N6)-dimethylallyltransferase MiaA [Candidatus Abyssubacteria bacterium SURF_5]
MPDLLVVCGPTAAGKTLIGARLAELLNGEVISADSMQVYRELDIGADKPPPDLRARVPHHMVDVVSISEPYSAARYEREAGAIVDRLLAENKLPVVVGGSGLYIRILLKGIFPAPPASASVRTRLKREAEERGVAILYERLQSVDAEYAHVAAPTDLRRIVRALEVFELTGLPFSEWHHRHKAVQQPRDAFMLGLSRPRQDLYRRIEKRIDEMIERGLVAEVSRLLEQGYGESLRRLRPLGYVELIDYLENRASLEEAIDLIKRNSRRYAKRQMTWFRKENVVWVEIDPNDDLNKIIEKAIPLLPEAFRRSGTGAS